MIIELELTELEAGYLMAAVTDFLHKMRSSAEDETITWVESDKYQAAKNLYRTVGDATQVDR